MRDIIGVFSKDKIDEKLMISTISKVFETNTNNIKIIHNGEEWADVENEDFVVLYGGIIDEEDYEEEYVGMFYYDFNYTGENCTSKIEELKSELGLIE